MDRGHSISLVHKFFYDQCMLTFKTTCRLLSRLGDKHTKKACKEVMMKVLIMDTELGMCTSLYYPFMLTLISTCTELVRQFDVNLREVK